MYIEDAVVRRCFSISAGRESCPDELQPVSILFLGAGGCHLWVAYAKPFQTWRKY